MLTRMQTLLAAGLLAGGLGLGANAVQAMPLGLDAGLATQADTLKPEAVRWVCGPYRCRWAPNYYAPGPRFYYGGPRRYWRPGWRRGGWRGGWRR